jgi:hypothetical protein
MGIDALTRCKAMEAFCRQRAKMESEAAGFWLKEAESWKERALAFTRKANGQGKQYPNRRGRVARPSPVHLPRFSTDTQRE